MKRLSLGLAIFIIILIIFSIQDNIELAMNVTGIIGLAGILIAGFLKTGFISSTAPVIGNLAIVKLDTKLDMSNTVLLLALPNVVGSFVLYFVK